MAEHDVKGPARQLRRPLRGGLWVGMGLLMLAGGLRPAAGAERAPEPVAEAPAVVIYHVRSGDTLIGVAHRLLVRGDLWRRLATFNGIARPRALAPDSELRIPVDWLRWQSRDTTVLAASGAAHTDNGPLRAGDHVAEGSHIVIPSDGMVVLALPDGSQLTVPGGTTLLLRATRGVTGSDAPDIGVELSNGQVDVSARKHHDTGRFEIRTPTAVTAVRGTEFRVHFGTDSDQAHAETLEGAVAVAASGTSVSVPRDYGTAVARDRPPLPPVPLLAPPDLAGLPATVTTAVARPAFAPLDQAVAYRVQLAGNAEFVPLLRDLRLTVPEAQLDGLPDGAYWLRVRGIDAHGIEGKDAVRQISVRVLPDAPALVATGRQESVSGTDALLRWQGEAARFHVQLARDGHFSELLFDRSDIGTNSIAVGDLAPGSYVWRVAGLTAAGDTGPWSASQPLLRRPAAPRIAGTTVDRERRTTLQLPVIAGYRCDVQVAQDPRFAKPLQTASSDGAQLQLPALRSGTYFARARWIDASGDAGGFGPASEFRVPGKAWPWWLLYTVGMAAIIW